MVTQTEVEAIMPTELRDWIVVQILTLKTLLSLKGIITDEEFQQMENTCISEWDQKKAKDREALFTKHPGLSILHKALLPKEERLD